MSKMYTKCSGRRKNWKTVRWTSFTCSAQEITHFKGEEQKGEGLTPSFHTPLPHEVENGVENIFLLFGRINKLADASILSLKNKSHFHIMHSGILGNILKSFIKI